MLLTHNSFQRSPFMFSFGKIEKSKISLFPNDRKSNSRIRNSEKIYLYNNDKHINFPSGIIHHPLESELPLLEEFSGDNVGIGIDTFFKGKNIFITGATGFFGKAFVEKLLRSTSVGKLYLLVQAKDKENALDRLTKEIIDSELFKCVREKHGSCYREFIREKLIPIVGNICEPNLGMDYESAHAIMKEVDVIVKSAASTTFDERYDVLFYANVIAPQRLMRFAKACKNLKLFVHISSAYVNGRREGIILENPLIMGENRRNENEDKPLSLYPQLDVTDEIKLAAKFCKSSTGPDVSKDLKRLGQERATFYGWHNTYQFSKAMAEMILNEIRGDVPLLIIRPSIIESSYTEPFPGWIQGNRMCDPFITAYGKGQLPAYLGDPEVHLDIVPVDMVVNTTIAAIAKHGIIHKPELNIYHAATTFVNPVKFSDIFQHLYEYFSVMPLIDSAKIDKMKFFNEFTDLSKYIRDEISQQIEMQNAIGTDGRLNQKIKKQYNANVVYAEQLSKMYEFAGIFYARFHTGNTLKLLAEMSKEERLIFEVDATKIDWRNYFHQHVSGLRKHVLGIKELV